MKHLLKKAFLFLALVGGVNSAWADTYKVTYNGADAGNTDYFTNSGNHNFNSKFKDCTYDGTDFTSGLKMESSTTISFTNAKTATVTIVQSTWSDKTIKFDDNALSVGDAEAITGGRVYTITDVAAGSHTIKRGSGEGGLFQITVEEISEAKDKPTITAQPQNKTYSIGDEAGDLSLTATASAGTLTYQWYSCEDAEKTNAAVIEGATAATLSAATAGISTASANVYYFYCNVKDDNGNVDSNVATITVQKGTVAEPTYTIGNYNYEEGGYAITPACATEGVTLTWKMSGGSDETPCTVGVPFYAKSGKVIITASKDGFNSNSTTDGNQWTINVAPSETSPEVLLPFGTSNDNSDKNAAHVYKSVTIGEDSNASSVGGSGGGSKSTSLKVRTNQTHDEVANSIMIYVHKGYKVTNLQVSAVSNNKGDGATIDLNGVYVDNKETMIDGFTKTTFPISTADAVTYSTGDIAATDYILLTFDNTNITGEENKKNNQLVAEFTVTYEEAAPTVSATITSAGWATFSSAYAVSIPDGVEAYAVKYTGGNTVSLTQVTEVPANTGVILKADEGVYSLPVVASAAAIANNNLLVSDGTIEGNASTIYVLNKKNENVGFYKLDNGVKLEAGKAYLEIPANSEARGFIGIEEATGINEVNVNKAAVAKTGKIYNLNGQIVNKPTKGLFIVDGKVVSF